MRHLWVRHCLVLVVDEEEQLLEPFYEYKVACRRLIAYLESLLSQMEDSDYATLNPQTTDNHRRPVEGDEGSCSSLSQTEKKNVTILRFLNAAKMFL